MSFLLRFLIMKRDEYGIVYGLEEFEHIKGFLDSQHADDIFEDLKKCIPWQKVMWKTSRYLPRLVFRYRDNNQRYEVIEELILYVEEVLETNVNGVWCNFYQKGSDYTPYHQDSYGCHVLSLSFGDSRHFTLRDKNTKNIKKFNLSHGDAFYFTPEINKIHEHSLLKKSTTAEPRISVVFFIDEPYSRRIKNVKTKTSLSIKVDSNLKQYLLSIAPLLFKDLPLK